MSPGAAAGRGRRARLATPVGVTPPLCCVEEHAAGRGRATTPASAGPPTACPTADPALPTFAGASGLTCLLLTVLNGSPGDIGPLLNGILAGAVSITAK